MAIPLKTVIASAVTFILIALAFLVIVIPSPIYAITVTVTTTITGWNMPDATHINNGIFPLIIPLMIAELFGGLLTYIGRGGDFWVTLYLLGIALGSSLGTLMGLIPIAMTVIAWVLIALWWWTGGQGEGSGASGDASLSLPKGWD